MFRVLTGRVPSSSERDILHRLYKEQLELFENEGEAAAQFLSTGTAERVTSYPASQLAALAVVANALFGHDECVMKR